MATIRTPKCPVCDRDALIEVDDIKLWRDWKAERITLEAAFPQMEPEIREMIRSGTHPECQAKRTGV